ncbi:MAG: hypothetical protein R3D78_06705 [Paracoccaceae bacterium]
MAKAIWALAVVEVVDLLEVLAYADLMESIDFKALRGLFHEGSAPD